jgi:hypothetical protein
MTTEDRPVTLEQIEALLNEASRLSNHRHFVIAGSLCAVGAVVRPPIEMVMSRDVDLYPKLDPGRGFLEIASHLGQGSAFAAKEGIYADPITPALLSMPSDWELRLMPISLRGGVTAWFVDPTDGAAAKLIRGDPHDLSWVKAALREGIVQPELLRARLSQVTSCLLGETSRAQDLLEECLSAVEKPQDDVDQHSRHKG